MFKPFRWAMATAIVSLLLLGAAAAQDLSGGAPQNLVARPRPLTAAAPFNLKMVKAVLLMRHGVRPPTSTPKFQVYSAAPLPTNGAWGAPDGNLTPNGAALVGALARVERSLYSAKGIIAPTGCPAAGDVFIWADNAAERTLATGAALATSLYTGCGLAAGASASATADPIFTPTFPLNTAAAQAAVLARMGGSFAPLQSLLAPLFSTMTSVTQCCSVTLCQQNGLSGPCGFGDLPWSITVSGGALSLNGPLANGSSLSQIFELEYANGFTGANLGYGALNETGVQTLEQLYTTKYGYFDRTPILAANKGSNIAQQMLDAVEEGIGTTPFGGPPNARLTVYVGHDTQLAALGGILNLHWALPTFPADDMPPASTLGFELLTDAAGNYYVRPIFLALTLDAMHAGLPKASFQPPVYQALQLPGCDLDNGRLCSLGVFEKLMSAAIDPTQAAPATYQ